jgi:hypothetical protein
LHRQKIRQAEKASVSFLRTIRPLRVLLKDASRLAGHIPEPSTFVVGDAAETAAQGPQSIMDAGIVRLGTFFPTGPWDNASSWTLLPWTPALFTLEHFSRPAP